MNPCLLFSIRAIMQNRIFLTLIFKINIDLVLNQLFNYGAVEFELAILYHFPNSDKFQKPKTAE